MENKSPSVTFFVGEKQYFVSGQNVTPETSLNTFLRENSQLTGTKKMCLEGGCGACIVVLEDLNAKPKCPKFFAVNSCLISVFSCHGKKVHTIEGIGGGLADYHPIQKVLAEKNGTQCGFCSSGMVMNMFALTKDGPLTEAQIENSFGSNICRCTGYRPILEAFKSFAKENTEYDIEDLKVCSKEDCKKECLIPCLKAPLILEAEGKSKWIKINYLKDLLSILTTTVGKYMLISGNTGRGVFKSINEGIKTYIDVSSVAELTAHSIVNNELLIGGNVTLNNVIAIFRSTAGKDGFSYLNKLADHLGLVAHIPVRNVGTIAGNLMLKHTFNAFQSDVFLILEAIDAELIIVDTDSNETRVSPAGFLKVDMNKKVIKTVKLKTYDASYIFESYKIMRRTQSTHAAVNAAFLFKLDKQMVKSARIIYGAINPKFVHATKTEQALLNLDLYNNDTLKKAFAALDSEIGPDAEPTDPSPQYRKQLAIALFYKFILKTAPENLVSAKNKSGGALLSRPVSSGSQEFGSDPTKYPLTQPISKIEALAQTSGQAQYIDDIPEFHHQLHATFFLAEASPGSKILTIDPSEALKVPGVKAVFDSKSIPGENTFIPKMSGFEIQEHIFCEETVLYYYQPIGIVVAETLEAAERASNLIKVTYEKPEKDPFLTIQQVLDANASDRINHVTTFVAKSTGNDVKHTIEGKFYTGMQYHFHMETHICVVVPTEDGLDVYPSTQWIDLVQMGISAATGLPMQKVNIYIRRLGGAFGAKLTRSGLVAAAASVAAVNLKRPIKIWVPLTQNMNMIGKRIPLQANYKVKVNDQGVIQSLKADLYSNFGAEGGNDTSDSVIIASFQSGYNSKTWEFSTYAVRTDIPSNCWTRAPGAFEATAAIESIMEHIAVTLNIDTLAVKKANLDKVLHPKLDKFLGDFIPWSDVDKRKQEIAEFNKNNRWKKRGLSVVPQVWILEVIGQYPVTVTIFHGDGGVAIMHSGVEMGQGINTKVVQVCAYKFGIGIDKVQVKPTNNYNGPNAAGSGGSLTSEAVCLALIGACDTLIKRMAPVKEEVLKKNPKATWEDIVNECYSKNIFLMASSLYSDEIFQQYPIYSVGATEVEVDILTGQCMITRVDILEDVGESMSPVIDIGQLEGAFVMGIGHHLTEEVILSKEGQLLNNRTWNYIVPLATDIPVSFRIKFPTNNFNEQGVLKSKAIAEPPICLTVNIALAIRDAIGSARLDSGSTQKWYPINGPSSIECNFLNALNDFKQYTL